MGLFGYFSYTSQSESAVVVQKKLELEAASSRESGPTHSDPSAPSVSTQDASNTQPLSPKDVPLPSSPPLPPASPEVTSDQSSTTPVPERQELEIRRFSFRTFSFTRTYEAHQPALSTIQDHERQAQAAAAFSKRVTKPVSFKSNKRAKESALILRSLIVGPSSTPSTTITKAVAKPQLRKVKSQLMKPKSANKVIAQLRSLPVSDGPVDERAVGSRGPIHAVCLAHTDAEEEELHFAHLTKDDEDQVLEDRPLDLPGVATASVDKLTRMFNEMHIIDLIKSPDLGLGQPGDGDGILAGAVPTAETVIKGIEQITPQLMALGFATGKAVAPDHKGVFPPTDRMSVLTYWWGLEVALPPPSLEYLSTAHSISSAIVNSLSALALINNGVREILPFVRYIGQFMDFEFNAIRSQDQGQGVVCASTWIMPAAMVPRPWDFPLPPSGPTTPTAPVIVSDRPQSTVPLRRPLPEVIITSPTSSAESVPSRRNKSNPV